MLLKRLFQAGIAGLAVGGAAQAADSDTVRLGRAISQEVTVAPVATTDDDDTELTGGYRGGYYGGYRGGYYGGYGRGYYGGYGGYGRSYYGGYYGGYGRSYYNSYFRYSRPYISIGFGYGGYYGGYYPRYYSSAYFYGISGTDAPTVNLGITTPQPLVTPLEMPTPAPAAQPAIPTETLKINSPAPRATVKYAAYGEK